MRVATNTHNGERRHIVMDLCDALLTRCAEELRSEQDRIGRNKQLLSLEGELYENPYPRT
jgi:hypothetical protein